MILFFFLNEELDHDLMYGTEKSCFQVTGTVFLREAQTTHYIFIGDKSNQGSLIVWTFFKNVAKTIAFELYFPKCSKNVNLIF